MRFLSLARTVVGSLMLLSAFCAFTGTAAAQAKVNKKDVTIETYDGVSLSGTFYPNAGGKRDATVILLHDFNNKGVGSSQGNEWKELAAALQADGYAVLAFDFRGHGDSKTVSDAFWTKNAGQVKKGKSLEANTFSPAYYPKLINDIAAAKAYLDRQNDNNSCNTSSTILIGAGSGAVIGNMWLAMETKRCRDKSMPNPLLPMPPVLADPEAKDYAAAIWLTIGNSVGRKGVSTSALTGWSIEASKKNKIPTAFVFGSNDASGAGVATSIVKSVNGSAKSATPTALEKKINNTKLTGEKLLSKDLGTPDWIKTALDKVMTDRGNKERIDRKGTTSRYFYATPNAKTKLIPVQQKPAGEDVGPIDLSKIGFGG